MPNGEQQTARRDSRRVIAVLVATVMATLLGACPPSNNTQVRATPAPPRGTSPSNPAGMREYSVGLIYDSIPPASDTMTLNDSAGGTGPLARIDPEIGSTAITRAELAAGRTIARIHSSGTYAPLGLRNGYTYVWADSSSYGWRFLLIAVGTQVGADTLVDTTHVTARLSGLALPAGLVRARFYRDSSHGPYSYSINPTCQNGRCCIGPNGGADSLRLDSLLHSRMLIP